VLKLLNPVKAWLVAVPATVTGLAGVLGPPLRVTT